MGTLPSVCRRTFSTDNVIDNEPKYIEQWQDMCIRPNAFYEEHAANRTYFYSVDLQGRLFLEGERKGSLRDIKRGLAWGVVLTSLITRRDYTEKYCNVTEV